MDIQWKRERPKLKPVQLSDLDVGQTFVWQAAAEDFQQVMAATRSLKPDYLLVKTKSGYTHIAGRYAGSHFEVEMGAVYPVDATVVAQIPEV